MGLGRLAGLLWEPLIVESNSCCEPLLFNIVTCENADLDQLDGCSGSVFGLPLAAPVPLLLIFFYATKSGLLQAL